MNFETMKSSGNNKSNEILVSVVVITYGHEKYIREALDSILMQKVNFKYEIIVGEDCSPDKTREILKEYEKNYPDEFVMIYRDKNIGARKNSYDVHMMCKGKYIAFLESDDYWIDKNKLQKQVDFLQIHEDFIAVTHKVIVIDENGERKNETYPCCKENVYSLKHYKKDLLPSQSASIVKRNYYRNYFSDNTILGDPEIWPGDRLHALIMVSLGKVYCMQEVMSAYRHVTSSGTSFSATCKPSTNQQLLIYYTSLLEFNNEELKNKKLTPFLETRRMVAVIRCFGIKSFKNLKPYWNQTQFKARVSLYISLKLLSWPLRRITYEISKYKNQKFN